MTPRLEALAKHRNLVGTYRFNRLVNNITCLFISVTHNTKWQTKFTKNMFAANQFRLLCPSAYFSMVRQAYLKKK